MPGGQVQGSQFCLFRVCVDQGPANIQMTDDGKDLLGQIFSRGVRQERAPNLQMNLRPV